MCLEYATPNKEPSGLQITRLTETTGGSLTRVVCKVTENALVSQTLKFLDTSRSFDPTSHSPTSPKLVPTRRRVC
uniref:Uncharacterized protein MANES_04G108600 n=1 Tax=Rhizophora mucronata TaxID=61149 RepID=A0A2P2MWX5_RHIMU